MAFFVLYTSYVKIFDTTPCRSQTARSPRPQDVRTVMFISRSPGGFTTALSTVCLLCVRMVCISPEKLLRATSRRNRLTFAFHPSPRLCPCSRHALRSRGCSFLRIVAASRSNMISRHDAPCGLQKALFASHM